MNSVPSWLRRPERDARATASASTIVSVLRLQHRPDDRAVEPDQQPVDRVFLLGNDPAAHENHHQRRHQRHRKQRRGRHRKGLGEGERAEQPPLLRLQREDRQERNGDDRAG